MEPEWGSCAGGGVDAEWEMGAQEEEDIEREWEDSLARVEQAGGGRFEEEEAGR